MKKILLLMVMLCTMVSYTQEKDIDNTTVYYFIRHAEKDRSNSQNKDPHLTEKGKKRAEKWAQVFKNISFDAIYSTKYNRTLQTARPAAKQNNIEVTFYDPGNFNSTAFKQKTKGKTVLVVGHSNTTPMLVNALLGKKKYATIQDNNNANLYILTLSRNTITDILLKID